MVHIRNMLVDDAAALAGLTQQLGYPISTADMANRVELFLNHPYGKVFVAELEGRVVGYICLWIREHFHDTLRAARILALVVDAEHRRVGVGKKLIEVAEQFARNEGCVFLDLTTAHHRTDAHTFYENIGYKTETTRYLVKTLVD